MPRSVPPPDPDSPADSPHDSGGEVAEARDSAGPSAAPEPAAPTADLAPEPSAAQADDEPTDDEPSLRAHLAGVWRDAPAAARIGAVAAALLLGAWGVSQILGAEPGGLSEDERRAQAVLDRAQWAAVRRQSPTPLSADAPVADALHPGDAERPDDRFADYYAVTADSGEAFSVLVTSDAFEPDLTVRLPSGATRAASSLLQTATRAETATLRGPGRFEVTVTSRVPRAQGAYEVAVVPLAPIDSLAVDDEVRLDTLGAGSLRAGRYERVYGLRSEEGLPIVVRVVSSAFRPRVALLGPSGEDREAARTTERVSQGDSLHGAVIRYFPGWDAPYRLLVSSEERGERGPFALSVESVDIRPLTVGERGLRATLGDESWIREGRYLDTYRVQIPSGVRATIQVESSAFAPAFRLWRIESRRRTDVAEHLNEQERNEVSFESESLDGDEYYLEVTSGGDPDEPALLGGEYGVSVRAEATAPDTTAAPKADGPVPETTVFATEVRRRGESGGDSFEVGVTQVAISYPGGARTRVQLSATVRSIDYTGGWAPWTSFVRQATLVDDEGRRYQPSTAESTSPSGDRAEPGTARRGTVVFYLPGVARGIDELRFTASIGERTLTLPIPVR